MDVTRIIAILLGIAVMIAIERVWLAPRYLAMVLAALTYFLVLYIASFVSRRRDAKSVVEDRGAG